MANTKTTKERQARLIYGNNVREARRAAKLTQTELGKKVGVGVAQVSVIERGDSWSSMPVYRRICAVLGVGVPPLLS